MVGSQAPSSPPVPGCRAPRFQCGVGVTCLAEGRVCDGTPDCPVVGGGWEEVARRRPALGGRRRRGALAGAGRRSLCAMSWYR